MISTLMKAMDGDALTSRVHEHEEEFATSINALPCPYPPEPLVRLYERSSALRPCVEAMTVNVHGFGHRLVPRVDLKAADVNEKIADIIIAERVWNGEDNPADPSELEVEQRKEEIRRGMRIEAIRLASFFKNCAREGWTALRKKLSTDLEVTGNAYLEVVRDASGRIARLNHCPAVNMRLQPLDRDPVRAWERQWVNDVEFELQEQEVRMRGFVQRVNAVQVFFKAFGDPRLVDSRDGKSYDRPEAVPRGARLATEIVHFAIHSGRTSYGIPRWIGAVFEVLGIEAWSQVNYLGFDNKGIPPLAISVSGGTLTGDSVKFLENYIKTRIKGRQNYHALLLLEAMPTATQGASAAGQTRIAIQPLAQPQDAVFLQYADRCEDVIARQWRISPITRGKTKDYNRATSDAAMKKDEEQVFQPARAEFDEQFERTVLRDLGVKYHRVESNSPIASDPEAMSKILDILMKHSLLDGNEGRRVASKIMNEDFRERKEDWALQPPALTIAGIQLQHVEVGEQGRRQLADVGSTLNRVLELRDRVRDMRAVTDQDAETKARMAEAGVQEELETEIDGTPVTVLRLAPDVMQKLVMPKLGAPAANDEEADAA